ncbi:AMP-binding protein [Streptomyces sp. NPDC048254]|uniref:AMP-binding protein n=1 Tax=Streptomyces sp. NPDC048254 TaxID=3365525 RepID=UPI00371647A6
MRHDLEFRSIPRMVRAAVERFGDAEALADLDTGRRWSFTDVGQAMTEAVRAVVALGVRPGDRVAVWGPNCPEWIFAALGIQGAGGILVPLNTRFKAEEAGYILAKSGACVVFTVSDFLGTDFTGMLPDSVTTTIVMRGSAKGDALGWADFLALGKTVPAEAADRAIDALSPDDPSDIMFTSGTTGRSKGVVLTHGQSLRAYGWLSGVFTFAPGDRYLIIPPFFHTLGYKAGWMACLLRGVTILPQLTFDVDQVLERIAREKVSIVLGPPTLFEDLMRHPQRGRHDLSSLRFTVPTATTVPAELVRRLGSELGFDLVLTAYGLTESTSLVSSCHPGDDAEDVAGSVGRPALDLEVIVADEAGRALPVGERGEVLVRGYTVTSGYWDEPGETAKAVDPDGWLHTGDIGRFNERGFLAIVDRKKDMFIAGGFNAYPAEIEQILAAHPGVAEVAVVGMPDDRLGEVAVAFVVRGDAELTERKLIGWARERMANFKVPRHVEFIDAMPRNASMKVDKGSLRKRRLS